MPKKANNPTFKTDMIGKTFNSLTVIGFRGQDNYGNRLWLCRCACGAKTIAVHTRLICGRFRSCGCRVGEVVAARGIKPVHGHSSPHSPTYASWHGMKGRCLNPNNPRFARYGGRGIKVSDRWQSFTNFLADMGQRPAGTSLDRIDNDGNYEPGNCRWATPTQQQNNCCSNVYIEFQGKRQSISAWHAETGLGITTIITRIRRGWRVEDVLTRPAQRRRATSHAQ